MPHFTLRVVSDADAAVCFQLVYLFENYFTTYILFLSLTIVSGVL